MAEYVVKLPDVGEGVAEAELLAWHVAPGDTVTPDTAIAEVLTDKATVDIYPPVAGVVAELHGEPGDVLAVGGDLLVVTTDAPGGPSTDATPAVPAPHAGVPDTPLAPPPAAAPERVEPSAPEPVPPPASATRGRNVASPAVRARARALDIDLAGVAGTGPDHRVVHADLDRLLVPGGPPARRVASPGEVTIEPVRGLRRTIAGRLTAAWTEIPHITYVDAVDATELETLRASLNQRGEGPRLTLLPFIARAIVVALADQPRLNAHYDASAGTLSVFSAVHLGIATQTPDGLTVPVVRHAESLGLRETAAEVARLADAAREGNATREELSGSSITITSLGSVGGLVTTPILNAPEVAIVGINKLETRPVWSDGVFVPRRMFNVSASFDHRIVDGWDAARFVQRLKQLLELPALLFVENGQATGR